MTTIFRLVDVDYVQWKAITRTLLRIDFRTPLMDSGAAFGKLAGLVTLALVLSLYGLGAALVVVIGRDLLLTGTIVLTYFTVMLATSLMTQHGMTLLATADYVILGSRPVSSRTFLAIRATNVLFHAFALTTLMAYPAVIAYTFAHGVNAIRGLASVLAIYTWTTVVALALVASYGTLLRAFGAARFRRALGYLQVVGGFMAYGGLWISNSVLREPFLAHATMPDSWWIMLLPPTWYATYLELAVGDIDSTTWLRAAFGVAALIALTVVLRGKLGVDYATRLAELPLDAGSSVATRTPFFTRQEARAAAILVLAHFRHDLRVRMGILAVVPLIALYLLIGSRGSSFDLIALAVLLFPALLTRHFATSDTPGASWIYRATPADHGQLIIAVKNIAVVYFLMPFLLFVAAVFAWRGGEVGHALVHTVMLGLLSHIALQGATLISPRLPFALPPDKTAGNASLMTWMTFVILGGQGALMALDRWVYVSNARTALVLASLVLLSGGLNRAIGWRAMSRRA